MPFFGKSAKWVYLPIEIKAREFVAKILIGAEAASKGMNVVVGDVAPVFKAAYRGPAGCLLFKDCSYPIITTFQKLVDRGHKICVHDEEGLVPFNDKVFLDFRVDDRTAEYVSLFFAWGRQHENVLLKKIEKERVARTGHPRFDILRPDLRGIFDDEVKALKSRFGKFILVNSNLAAWNHLGGPETYIRICKEQEAHGSEEDIEFFLQYQQHVKMLYEKYIPLVRRLALEFPEHSIVFRPHPAEDRAPWDEMMKNEPCVFIEDEGTVSKWLHACDIIVHSNCTTAIESVAMGTHAVEYMPVSRPEFGTLPSEFSTVCVTEDDVVATLHEQLQNGGKAKPATEHIHRLAQSVSANDGEWSATRMVDAIDKMGLANGKLWPSFRNAVLPIVRNLGRQLTGSNKETQKWPTTSISEVRDLIQLFSTVSGKYQGIKARQADKNLFYIYKE